MIRVTVGGKTWVYKVRPEDVEENEAIPVGEG